MSPSTTRVLAALTRLAANRGVSNRQTTATASRFNGVRSLSLSCQRLARPKDEVVNNEPIKFSTSKGSHRNWKVDRSLGSQFERPWWKVIPLSVFCIGFLLWCALRQETDVDEHLGKQLYEHLPGLLSDQEEEEGDAQNKPS